MNYAWRDAPDRRQFLHAGSLAVGAILGGIVTWGGERLLRHIRPTVPRRGPMPGWPEDFQAAMAVSLHSLQARLRDGKKAGLDGLTRIRGVSLEGDGDVLLLGDRDPAFSSVEVDDLALALRSAYQVDDVYSHTPGCTIDPREGASDPWQIQVAQILGMPPTAAMGARFLAADYELKKVSVGVLSLDDSPDLFTLSRKAAPLCTERSQEAENKETVHRFWFCSRYGPAPRFLQDGSSLWVRSPVAVQLLTEQELLDRNARRVGGKEADPLARQFADAITGLLDRAEAPQYARMRCDFRTLEAGKLIRYLNAGPDSLRFLLEEYRLATVSSPSYVGGIWREDQNEVVCENPVTETRTATGSAIRSQARVRKSRHRVIGGVDAQIEVTKEACGPAKGQLAALLERVRKARPSTDAVSWRV